VGNIVYKPAEPSHIAAMAEIRAGDWGSEEFWRPRIAAYLRGESHPQHARASRIAYVAVEGERVVGLVAGHLTRRFQCDGELEWISIRPEYRGRGIADALLRLLARWFLEQAARRICVDVEPTNAVARRFYGRNGAVDLKPSWMVWEDISQVPTDRTL
jgi:ribosomal protein S18 acetylase RimI-like enzyme